MKSVLCTSSQACHSLCQRSSRALITGRRAAEFWLEVAKDCTYCEERQTPVLAGESTFHRSFLQRGRPSCCPASEQHGKGKGIRLPVLTPNQDTQTLVGLLGYPPAPYRLVIAKRLPPKRLDVPHRPARSADCSRSAGWSTEIAE